MAETYLHFPFGLTPEGGIETVDENEHVRQRIEQILFTSPGERVMVPDFGSGVRDLVFEPNNEVLAAAVEFKIARALQRYMGTQVMINEVDVEAEEERLRVHIKYTKTRDLQQERTVFHLLPFEVG